MVSSALATLVSLQGPGAGGLAVTSEAVLPNPTQRGQGSTTSPLELQTHSFKCCPLKSLLATRETTILPNQRYRHAVSPAFSFLSSFPPALQTVHNCVVTVPKPVTPSLSHAADCHQLLPSTTISRLEGPRESILSTSCIPLTKHVLWHQYPLSQKSPGDSLACKT